MENTNQIEIICSLCGKPISELGIEWKITLSHGTERSQIPDYDSILYLKDFKKDPHLKCRVRCAKYSSAGLKSRWLSSDKFVVTNNNKVAFDCIENIKRMSLEEMRRHGIYLYGQPGTGKTHLLADLCCNLIDRGAYYSNVTWANTSSILTTIRSSFGKKYGYEEDTEQEKILERLKRRYLFLDDLGTESATDWSKEILYEVINFRYEERLPTFISSNLSPKELANKLGDKFASRVIEMCRSVKTDGVDWRLQSADLRNQGTETKKIEVPVFSYHMANWDREAEYKQIIETVL